MTWWKTQIHQYCSHRLQSLIKCWSLAADYQGECVTKCSSTDSRLCFVNHPAFRQNTLQSVGRLMILGTCHPIRESCVLSRRRVAISCKTSQHKGRAEHTAILPQLCDSQFWGQYDDERVAYIVCKACASFPTRGVSPVLISSAVLPENFSQIHA